MTQLSFSDLPAINPMFGDIAPHVVDDFFKFHQENQTVYELFKEYAHQIRRSGFSQYGAKAIMERIRWNFEIEQRHGDFKLNNNWASCYARLLIQNDPSYKTFFEVRSHLKAA